VSAPHEPAIWQTLPSELTDLIDKSKAPSNSGVTAWRDVGQLPTGVPDPVGVPNGSSAAL